MQAVADYEFERWLGSSTNGDNFLARPPARLGLTAEHVVVKVISEIGRAHV